MRVSSKDSHLISTSHHWLTVRLWPRGGIKKGGPELVASVGHRDPLDVGGFSPICDCYLLLKMAQFINYSDQGRSTNLISRTFSLYYQPWRLGHTKSSNHAREDCLHMQGAKWPAHAGEERNASRTPNHQAIPCVFNLTGRVTPRPGHFSNCPENHTQSYPMLGNTSLTKAA